MWVWKLVAAVLGVALVMPAGSSAGDNEFRVVKGAEATAPARARSVDVDLRDLPRVRDWSPGDPIKEIPRRHTRKPDSALEQSLAGTQTVDPLLALQADAVASSDDASFGGSVLNIAGQGFTGVNPPDTSSDVGPNHFIQAINHSGGSSFVIYNKTGAVLAGPTLLDTLGAGDCASGLGDPIILYDKLANRWLMSEFSETGNKMCVYISKTADPVSGGWWAYAFAGVNFPDYPHYGVWPDAYYVGTNENTLGIYAFDRAKMLTGAAATAQRFTTGSLAGFGFQILQPADHDGATAPPSGAPGIFMRHRDDEVHNAGANNPSSDFLDVYQFAVNWTSPASSTFSGPTSVAIAEFDSNICGLTSFACVPQSGSATTLDPLREPIMYRLQYRNFGSYQALAGNLTTDVATDRAGIRWFELRKTTGGWFVHQQGTYAPDTLHRWMGAASLDSAGNMALAYSVSSSGSFPSLRYVGRLATDPAGTMPQGETSIVAGSAANSSNRWGDYSQMGVDPSDDCTFWFSSQYSPSTQWSTRIAAFKFASCGGAPAPNYSVSASPSSVSANPGASTTTTVTVTSINSFNAAVALTASGLPSGASASFAPASVTPAANGTANSTMTLNAGTAAAGTYTVTITGTNGATTRTTTVSFTVNGPAFATFDPALQAPKCSSVLSTCDSGPSLLLGRGTMTPAEPNQPNTINDSCADGGTGTYHSDESNDRLKVTSVDGTPFAPGKSVRIDATVWAFSTPADDKLDLYYAASASSPSWVFIATLQPAVGGQQVLTATYTLPAGGATQAVRARFRYQGSAAACNAGSYDDHDDLIFAVGGGDTTNPTTSLTAPAAGATVSGTTSVTASASDNVGVQRVEFWLDGGLANTDTTAPYAWSWNTVSTSNGSHTLQSRAYDAAGNNASSATRSVTVSNSGVTPSIAFTGGPLADGDRTYTEGDTANTTATFQVSLSSAAAGQVTVNFATGASGTATSGVDYVARTGVLTFLAGETIKSFTIAILPDTAEEIDEIFYVNLSAPVGGTIADGQAIGTIQDNDPPPPGSPTVNVSDAQVVEGNTGTVNAVFTITLTAASANTVTVPYATGTGGTATVEVDYVSKKGSLTFTPGQTSKTINVFVSGDLIDEPNETFYFNLKSAAYAILGDKQGLGTITDNDAP